MEVLSFGSHICYKSSGHPVIPILIQSEGVGAACLVTPRRRPTLTETRWQLRWEDKMAMPNEGQRVSVRIKDANDHSGNGMTIGREGGMEAACLLTLMQLETAPVRETRWRLHRNGDVLSTDPLHSHWQILFLCLPSIGKSGLLDPPLPMPYFTPQ